SWLPRIVGRSSAISRCAVSAGHSGPERMSPRFSVSSAPLAAMSASTASRAGRLPCTSEITAMRIALASEIAHPFDRLLDALDGVDRQPFDRLLRHVGLGHHGDREAELGGFLQPFLAARRRADLAGQAHFAESEEAPRQ